MADSALKLVQAIVRQDQVTSIVAALEQAGVLGLTAMNVEGRGRHGATGSWRGRLFPVLLPMSLIQVITPSENAEDVARIIAERARTGHHGDGHVFVLAIEQSQAIRTRWLNAS